MKKKFSKFLRNVSFLGIFLSLMSVQQFYAQKTVTGKVTDETNQGIPGVNILKQGTSSGASTDFDGNYSIKVNDTDVLVFSFVGYKTKSVKVGANTKINVKLEPDVASLDEVVVIGYGTAKKSDLTGSVGVISSKDLLKAPITKIGAGLQGKITGVNIQQTTGAPGQGMKIRIRGGSSINYSNNPLYVIDGFIGADISTINPNDIATINFLKDASATAIYGSRGANGVVLITTNAPKSGKLKVSFETNFGFSNVVNKYDLLSPHEQAELMNEQRASLGESPYFTQTQIDGFRQNGGTDWQDLVTQNGYKYNHTLNVSGGNDNLKYFFSANHLDEEGTIKNTFYKRTSLRSNIAGNISDRISFKFNTYGVHTDSQGNGVGTAGTGNVMGNAVIYPQMWESRDANGDFIDGNTNDSYNGAFLVGRLPNPEMDVRQNQESLSDRVLSNIDINVELTDKLTMVLGGSGSLTNNYSGQRTLADFIDITRSNITAQQRYVRNNSWLVNGRLTYENEFGDHNLKASAIYEFSKATGRNLTAAVGELSTLANEWYYLGNGQATSTTSNFNLGKIRSYMARVNYSYKDKYLLTASMRADGSSRFQPDYRWGYFPSAALAWKISEEDFIKNTDWISNLKLRVGYGATGNTAIGYGDTQPTFAGDPTARNFGWYPLDNGVPVQGVVPNQTLTSVDTEWETTTSYNAGLDFGILDSKLTGSIDVYSKKTTGVIIQQSVARYTGLTGIQDNFADIDNNGIEIGLNWNIKSTDDLNWTAYGNFSRNKNIVQDLGGDVDQIFVESEEAIGIWSLVGGNKKFVVQKGESLGALYGLKAIGIWQENEAAEAAAFNSGPGEVRYEDLDGDGAISAADRQIVGQTAPDFTYGFGSSLSYKNWDFSVQCIGTVGNDIYNWTDNRLNYGILDTDYRNRWSPTNTSSTQQVMPYGTDYSLTYVVSQYIEKGSFFKVSNLTVGYNMPQSILDALKISNLRLYASMDNVLTITDYSGLDPEGSSTPANSDSQAGVDAFSYPLTRTVSAGLKLTF
ncbi:TonB-linked outer membrane protein, SusC/RagA family [Lutibacter oricola]|uniref:TonB-linked outer membrane protein, SusC/RagA family n=1 Tax=Lutibacter oricola TaxID=762486 RepID=A0A1H3FH26_9FLAO|nr:TonB-dependent receptor [Lutibacter oricola]SDX90230.1 TonB-linked outer membrane protein, SusC/RagA family [Lutibacter oricola]